MAFNFINIPTALFAGAKFRVNTDTLKSKADSVSASVAQMITAQEALTKAVTNMDMYWEGDGRNAKREEYMEKKEMMETIVNRLQEYPTDLLEIAGVYEQAETANVSHQQALSSDVIV